MAFPPNPYGDHRRRRIGLLGGSFNPAHDGHRHVADAALRLLGLDQVWLLVSPQNPLKDRAGMAPLAQRLESAQRVLQGDSRLLATDLESRLGTKFTIDSLRLLVRRFPRARFVWLMGADNLLHMAKWRRWRDIFDAVPVAILARSPYSRKSLGSSVARAMSRRRSASSQARGLAERELPAWVFLHTRLHPASATQIRAGFELKNVKEQTD